MPANAFLDALRYKYFNHSNEDLQTTQIEPAQ